MYESTFKGERGMTFDEWWADKKNWQRHIGAHKKLSQAAWDAGADAAHRDPECLEALFEESPECPE